MHTATPVVLTASGVKSLVVAWFAEYEVRTLRLGLRPVGQAGHSQSRSSPSLLKDHSSTKNSLFSAISKVTRASILTDSPVFPPLTQKVARSATLMHIRRFQILGRLGKRAHRCVGARSSEKVGRTFVPAPTDPATPGHKSWWILKLKTSHRQPFPEGTCPRCERLIRQVEAGFW